MNALLQRSTSAARRAWALGAARVAFVSCACVLCACTHDGRDDVKPTATTAYHSAPPAPPQAGEPAQDAPRQ